MRLLMLMQLNNKTVLCCGSDSGARENSVNTKVKFPGLLPDLHQGRRQRFRPGWAKFGAKPKYYTYI